MARRHEDRIDALEREGWRGFAPPFWGRYNPNRITWGEVRHEILSEMVRLVLVMFGDRSSVDLFRDPLWAVYVCRVCGERRAGFANVGFAHHTTCPGVEGFAGNIRCEDASLPYVKARRRHDSDQLPLGVLVREELGLTTEERYDCLRRFWREIDSGKLPRRVDTQRGSVQRLRLA